MKSASNNRINEQIKAAFDCRPNLARTLHGRRKISEGLKGRTTSLFPSQKSQGTLPLESRLELAHAVILERDSTVKQFRTQAISITLDNGGFAIPDFVVEYLDGSFEVHEVKPSISGLTQTQLSRFEWAEKALASEGVAFRLVEACSLPTNAEVDELLHLYMRGHTHAWTAMQIGLAIESLSRLETLTISLMHGRLSEDGLPKQMAEFLIFHNHFPSVCGTNLFGARSKQ